MHVGLHLQNNTQPRASPMRKPGSKGNCSSLPRPLPYTKHLWLAHCMLGFGTLTTKNGCTRKNRQRLTVQGAHRSLCTSLVRAALSAGTLSTYQYLPAGSPSNQRLRVLMYTMDSWLHALLMSASRRSSAPSAEARRIFCSGKSYHCVPILHQKSVQRTFSRAAFLSTSNTL